jgi:hypothetical protein
VYLSTGACGVSSSSLQDFEDIFKLAGQGTPSSDQMYLRLFDVETELNSR